MQVFYQAFDGGLRCGDSECVWGNNAAQIRRPVPDQLQKHVWSEEREIRYVCLCNVPGGAHRLWNVILKMAV